MCTKLDVIRIIKPVNVSIIPPTRKIIFGFINEKTMFDFVVFLKDKEM